MASRRNRLKKKDNGLSKQCPQCGHVYSNRSNLMKHVRHGCEGVKPPEGPPYRCVNCPRVYNRKGHLTRHLKKCDRITPHLPNEDEIDEDEGDKDNLVQHVGPPIVQPIFPLEGLPVITRQMLGVIRHANSLDSNQIVNEEAQKKHGTTGRNGMSRIYTRDIQRVYTGMWLDDTIINDYLKYIQMRADRDNSLPKIFIFDTFVYTSLKLCRWKSIVNVPKPKIFDKDILIFPIHKPLHWCMAAIFLKKREIRYYDSMGERNDICMETLWQFIIDEAEIRRKEGNHVEDDITDKTTWKFLYPTCPQQGNDIDCGMFVCKCAEFLSRGVELTFTQAQMPYYRERMVYELVTGVLISP